MPYAKPYMAKTPLLLYVHKTELPNAIAHIVAMMTLTVFASFSFNLVLLFHTLFIRPTKNKKYRAKPQMPPSKYCTKYSE